ncbi:hypothetical protein EON66_00680 [archaeon]|nr:MAG: hypothetical protein EON66_00680 [archaeon]
MSDVLYPADVRRWLLLKHQVRIPYEPGNDLHESMLLELWSTAFPHAARIQPVSVWWQQRAARRGGGLVCFARAHHRH